MGHLVLAQQGNLTFDQFRWLWIGAMSAFGVIFIIGGLTFKKSNNAGRSQVRQTLMGLIRSGLLREEEITQALNAPHLPPAPDEMSGQVWLDRILAGSPPIEQLIRLWKRPLWVEASLYAGFGIFLACGVCALLFLALPVPPQTSAFDAASLALLLSLPLMGMLMGLGAGLFRGIFNAAAPGQRLSNLARPTRQMEQYRSRWYFWGGIILFLVPCLLTLSALPFLASNLLEVIVVGLGALPLLTLGALLLHEYFVRRLAYLPPIRLGDDPALAERFDRMFFFPRLIRVFRWSEYGLLGTMTVGQLLLTLLSVSREALDVYAVITLGLIFLYIIPPIIAAMIQQWQGGWLGIAPANAEGAAEESAAPAEGAADPPSTP